MGWKSDPIWQHWSRVGGVPGDLPLTAPFPAEAPEEEEEEQQEQEEKLGLSLDQPEGEDMELQVAAQQLTQDFLCQVLEEVEEEPGSRPAGGLPGCRPCSQSLSSILGIGRPIHVSPEEPEGKSFPSGASLDHGDTQHIHCVCLCVCDLPLTLVVFADVQSESGELDLEGIDDQEIDKVWTCGIHSALLPFPSIT